MAARLARRFPSPQFELKADVIEEVISEVEALCRSYSMIDDNAFSRRRASAGVRAGKSKWSTTMALRAKGIDSETASDCLSEYDDLVAALHFLRKKKMGPFAEREEGHDRRQRVMGAFLRCGFSSSLWNRTGAMSIDEAEERMSTVRL
jgi:regulatory protein